MNRFVALAACGFVLAGCESMQTLQFPGTDRGAVPPITLNIESTPPGAEAALSTGGSCVTPCALPVPVVGDLNVSFTLKGHEPGSLSVRVIPAEKNFLGVETAAARFEPNPARIELKPLPPPKRRPRARPRPTQPAPPASAAPASPWPSR